MVLSRAGREGKRSLGGGGLCPSGIKPSSEGETLCQWIVVVNLANRNGFGGGGKEKRNFRAEKGKRINPPGRSGDLKRGKGVAIPVRKEKRSLWRQ